MDGTGNTSVSPISKSAAPASSPEPPVASSFRKTVAPVKVKPIASPEEQVQFSSSGFLFPEPSTYGGWPLKAPLAKGDYLFARSVALKLSDIKRTEGLYRTQSEIDYLSSQKRSPKPATLLVPGVPVELHMDNSDLALLLKKDSGQVLAAYKKDAGTNSHADLDQLEVKRIAGVSQLESKLREINLRRFPGLPDESWGGMDEQGQVKAPKKKPHANSYYRDSITENEVILTDYGADDILAIMLTENTPLLVQNGLTMPVVYHLDKKKKLEESLGLEPLPVVFYNQQTGQIVSSLSAQETNKLGKELREITPFVGQLPFDPSSLPAFYENGFNKECLDRLKERVGTINNAPIHDKKDLHCSIERLNNLVHKIEEGDATAETYQQFADFPSDLTRYVELTKNDMPTLAGSDSYKDRIPLIKLLAFNTVFRPQSEETKQNPSDKVDALNPSDLNHAENWQDYQKANLERISVIDDIFDKASVGEKVRKTFTVNAMDFSQNPYMAIHWLKKYCDLNPTQNAEDYLFNAIHFIDELPYKLSISERKKYFNDVLAPLFNLLSENYSSEELKKSTLLINQKLMQTLTKWIACSKDKFPENATLNDQLIREMNEPSLGPNPDPTILLNDIKLLFNTMAQMVYFYEQYNPADKQWAGKELRQSIKTLKAVNEMLTEKHFGQSFFSKLHFPVKRSEFTNWIANAAGDQKQRLPESGIKPVERKAPAAIDNKEALVHNSSLEQTLQKVIEHYYLSPHPAQLSEILEGKSVHNKGSLWRHDHGVDHIARTVILMEGVISLHKQYSPAYQALFQRHPGLEKLLSLAIAYHDVVAEIAPKSEEERLAAEALERDLGIDDQPDTTTKLVISALKNKNVDIMEPITEGYTADAQACSDERMIRRLLRLPDSIDIARVKEVVPTRSFTPPQKGAAAVESNQVYSMDWMDLDPELVKNPEFMANWTALMQTSVLWAGSTGAPPANAKSLTPADIVPYSASPDLLPRDDFFSRQRQKVIARDADSIGYTRERLNDIVRLYVARQAGREVGNLFQLRQIQLPDDWTALDSFLHFTGKRQQKLEPLIHHWRKNEFKHHYGTLTQTLLNSPTVREIVQEDWHLTGVKRQRGYDENGEPKYEGFWKMTERQ